jgi:hypothetical protein
MSLVKRLVNLAIHNHYTTEKGKSQWGWLGKIFLAATLVAGFATAATAPIPISDNLHNADGSLANGTIYISNPTFQDSTNSTVAANTIQTKVVNGVVSVSLVPTTNAITPNVFYSVTYAMLNGPPVYSTREFWAVPPPNTGGCTTTCSLGSVRVAPFTSFPGLMRVVNGGTGDTTLAAHGVLVGEGSSPVNVTSAGTVGECLMSNGASADPTYQNCLTVGVTAIGSGTNGYVEYNNAGTLGELATTGSGNVVRATSPTLVTPSLGQPTALDLTNATKIPLTLTTTGTSGAATYTQSTDTLNIPQYSGGGGATSASQLLDFGYVKTSNTVATLGTNCASSTPCDYRFGAITTQVTASATATISGSSSSDTVYFYISENNSPALTVGYNGTETITCSGCTATSGVTGFPTDGSAIPLYTATITSNVWASTATDDRAVYSKEYIKAGQSIVVQPSGVDGSVTVQTDSTVVPRYFTGVGAPSSSCTTGRDYYTNTSSQTLYSCTATNTWTAVGGSSSQTINQYFSVGDYNQNSTLFYLVQSPSALVYCGSGGGSANQTGPNSLSYRLYGLLAAINDWEFFRWQAPSTWSAAAGTVDLAIDASNCWDGSTSAGSWNFNFYVGCAASGAYATYGTASTAVGTPPATASAGIKTYSVTGLNLPAACAANVPMEFWVQRVADTGGTTGARPVIYGLRLTMRGN